MQNKSKIIRCMYFLSLPILQLFQKNVFSELRSQFLSVPKWCDCFQASKFTTPQSMRLGSHSQIPETVSEAVTSSKCVKMLHPFVTNIFVSKYAVPEYVPPHFPEQYQIMAYIIWIQQGYFVFQYIAYDIYIQVNSYALTLPPFEVVSLLYILLLSPYKSIDMHATRS